MPEPFSSGCFFEIVLHEGMIGGFIPLNEYGVRFCRNREFGALIWVKV